VGFLDRYRQFEEIKEEELNRLRRARREREKQLALQRVDDLDLSGTEWPELPYSEIVNAAIYTARGRVNSYPDRHAAGVRRLLGERHGIEPERIVLGNGAAELLRAAAGVLLGPGDELVTPWPSYPLYPLLATHAGARPVFVDTGPAGEELDPLLEAVNERTRVVVLCNPNDPTGTHLPSQRVAALLARLPERVHVLLDEALVHFQDREPEDACLRLTDARRNLLAVRSFSKIYGLSGLRAGYAVGSDASADLLGRIAPALGVNALTQAAVEYALRAADREIDRRRLNVHRERRRLLEALRELPVDATDSQANFVWLRARDMSGVELAARLRDYGVIVAHGGPLGAEDHVRAAVRDAPATDRLLAALGRALER
jgi:histidinol-phosphate aminotransferase